MKAFQYLVIAVFALTLLGCGTYTGAEKEKIQAHKKGTRPDNSVSDLEDNILLVDYVRRLPGVMVSGREGNYSVTINGTVGSFTTNPSPLFVLDGVPMGRDINNLNESIPSAEIKHVRVIKDGASLSFYGVQGGNGVIIIETRKS